MSDPAKAIVSVLTLDPRRTSIADFETAMKNRFPGLQGSLMTWLVGNQFAAGPELGEELRKALPAANADFLALGLSRWETLSADKYFDQLQRRGGQTEPSGFELRDRALQSQSWQGVLVETPQYFLSTTDTEGRPLLLDWYTVACGFDKTQVHPNEWSDLKVGHIDTGYTEHPALGFLAGKDSWVLAKDGLNLWRKKVEAPVYGDGDRGSTTPENPTPLDNLTGPNGGHGTRTSCLISGFFKPSSGIDYPFVGAAPGVHIIPYRITDSVVIDHVQNFLAEAIEHAVGQGVSVISISLGALRADSGVKAALDNAYEAGVIVCAAAGQYFPAVIYPGRFSRTITLGGASTPDGKTFQPWSSAARGPEVDVCGPADKMRRPTTVLDQNRQPSYAISNGGDGTSFATALCAGLAIQWLGRHREALRQMYGETPNWKRVEAFRKILVSTALVPAGWPKYGFGAGVYQADKALAAELPTIADTDIR